LNNRDRTHPSFDDEDDEQERRSIRENVEY